MRALFALLLLATSARAEVIGFNEHNVSKTVHYAMGAASAATPDAASTIWPDSDVIVDHLTCLASDATTHAPKAPGAGEQWTISVMMAAIGSPFAVQTQFCAIANANTHCVDSTNSDTWGLNVSTSFKVVGTSGVPSGTDIACGMRVGGNFYFHADAIAAPTSGAVTAYGTATVVGTTDYSAMQEVNGTFGTTMHTLLCISDTDPGVGNGWTFRLRAGTGATFAWANTPINCTMTGAGVQTCLDAVNTQNLGSLYAVNFRVTAVGTPPAARLRCALVYSF